MALKAVDTVWKSFRHKNNKIIMIPRNTLGKYFNLIIRQATNRRRKKAPTARTMCMVWWSHWVINLSLVLRSHFFYYAFFVHFWLYDGCCCCRCCITLSNFSPARTQQFMAFNVLMTLTTFKLWIYVGMHTMVGMGSKKANSSNTNANSNTCSLTSNCPSL